MSAGDGAYPLAMLMKVREHREDEARRAEEEACRAVAQAQNVWEDAQQKLHDFRLWRIEEENRRYAAILGKDLDKKALDNFRAGLAALAEQEVKTADEVRQAAEHVRACGEAEKQTAELLRQAVKDSIRIQEHRDLWRVEELRNAEHREEQELEP